jgi:hypothetical protein
VAAGRRHNSRRDGGGPLKLAANLVVGVGVSNFLDEEEVGQPAEASLFQ